MIVPLMAKQSLRHKLWFVMTSVLMNLNNFLSLVFHGACVAITLSSKGGFDL